ncbi:MAG: hypothetical protein EA352_01685 [Gemmatimonadales bacterium]|nr:MAG: hypothetical protein EA352_01685 [Gemmatimonadales bacterium]
MIRPLPTPRFSREAHQALHDFLQEAPQAASEEPSVVVVRATRADDGEFDLELRFTGEAEPPGEGEFDLEASPLTVRCTAGTALELDGQEIHFGEERGFRGFLVREAGPSGSRAPGPSSPAPSPRTGDLPVLNEGQAFSRPDDARAAAGLHACGGAASTRVRSTPPKGDPELVSAVLRELENRVNPLVESHGGAVHLLAVTEAGVAQVEMSGGCQGCAAARGTLEDVVARILRKAVPALTGVTDVTDHAAGEAPWFQPA